jgi:hypothetical protein
MCIQKLLNLTITRLIVYKGMALHKITEFFTKWFSICPSVTSKFRTTAIFKGPVKENNGPNNTCSYVYDPSLYKTSFVWSKWNSL